MKASICISAYKRPVHLRRCLASIRRQEPRASYEVIVIDDGTPGDEIAQLCRKYDVEKYCYLNRRGWNTPAKSWNTAFKMAEGEILIIQQADVIHATRRVIDEFCDQLKPLEALAARVDEWNPMTNEIGAAIMTTSSGWFGFFLGAIHRQDMYSVGGNDTDFVKGACEDVWLDYCMRESGITPRWSNTIVGLHQSHPRPRPPHIQKRLAASKRLLAEKVARAQAGEIPWCASGGPWTLP